MIAQDTGSAIVGPARADLYWGAGDDAGRIAGRIRHPAASSCCLPRELDMIEAGKHMPLPVAKPKIRDDEPDRKTAEVQGKDRRPRQATRPARRRQDRRRQEGADRKPAPASGPRRSGRASNRPAIGS